MIRHRHSGLFERFDALEKLVNFVCAVKQAVFSVAVKMNEAGVLHRSLFN